EDQRTLEVLNRTASKLNAEHDLTALLGAVTDAAVELTGAGFAALFSGHRPTADGAFELYALSGIERPQFDALPLPREQGVVGPIIDGPGIFRWDDVTADEKYAEKLAIHALRE